MPYPGHRHTHCDDIYELIRRARHDFSDEKLEEIKRKAFELLHHKGSYTIRFAYDKTMLAGTTVCCAFPSVQDWGSDKYGPFYYQANYGYAKDNRCTLQLIIFRDDLPDGHNCEVHDFCEKDYVERYIFMSDLHLLHEDVPPVLSFWQKVKEVFTWRSE